MGRNVISFDVVVVVVVVVGVGILNTYSILYGVRSLLPARWGFLRLWGNRDVLTSSDAPFMRKAKEGERERGGVGGGEHDVGEIGLLYAPKDAPADGAARRCMRTKERRNERERATISLCVPRR